MTEDYFAEVDDLHERLHAECEGERVAVVVGALSEMLDDADTLDWLEFTYSNEPRSGANPPAGKGEEWDGKR